MTDVARPRVIHFAGLTTEWGAGAPANCYDIVWEQPCADGMVSGHSIPPTVFRSLPRSAIYCRRVRQAVPLWKIPRGNEPK